MRAVYVRGVGVVSPLGVYWPTSRTALAEGRSAIRPISFFDSTDFPCRVAAEIPEIISNELNFNSDRRISLLEKACDEAWEQSRLNSKNKQKIGIFIGAESGRSKFTSILQLSRYSSLQPEHPDFSRIAKDLSLKLDFSAISPAAVASFLAKKYQTDGPCQTVSLACSSSLVAIIEAVRNLQLGICDHAICGGVGADIDPLILAGFGKISALSSAGISRPFDIQRDGFIVGEGAAVIILSIEKGQFPVQVTGTGRSLDAYNLTAPDPDGNGAERAIRKALEQSQSENVDYIQAHGTSTFLNDKTEAKALHKVFSSHMKNVHVSSIKGALGHWIAGAGALGFVAAFEAVVSGLILPTAGLSTPDPSLKLMHVVEKAIQKNVRSALVNSFGFGGANASLLLERTEHHAF